MSVCALAALSVLASSQLYGEDESGQSASGKIEYRLLATTKTSTMQKEMSEAAADGFRLGDVMGGETFMGGSEVVIVMCKDPENQNDGNLEYRLLATNKTSTMQKELQEAADNGFEYRGQTVFETTFGGNEVVIILERDKNREMSSYEYKLLATRKTGTMQKELIEAGEEGFEFIGLTVAETSFGGNEVVSIMRRKR
jgi:hypothetical protein